MSSLFRTKAINKLLRQADEPQLTLKRSITTLQLLFLGLGSIVGYGAMILTGMVSARFAGPAILISIAISAFAALLTSLCYAELASMVPVAGSGYTYAYATLGELPAWFIAWELLLEYIFGAAMVSWGWSGYLSTLLRILNIHLPPQMLGSRWDTFVFYQDHWVPLGHVATTMGTQVSTSQGLFNLPAALIVLLFTLVLYIGIKESVTTNNLLVYVNLFILLFFIVAGALFLSQHPGMAQANLHPFLPPNIRFGEFGWTGVARAAAVFFVSFLGIDAVSSAAQEARNPQRDLVFAGVCSVLISTVIFGLFALVLLATVNFHSLDVVNPLAVGMEATHWQWASTLITLGALGALCAPLLGMLLGATRVIYSMSRDGLLPQFLGRVHPRFRTPMATILVGLLTAIVAGAVPFDWLMNIFSIGVLTVFLLTTVGVAFFRLREPNYPRSFKVPGLFAVVAVAAPLLLGLMFFLPRQAWIRFAIWPAAGLLIYFLYSRRNSKLELEQEEPRARPQADELITPEMHFIDQLLKGLLRLFLLVLAMVAVSAALSILLPRVETDWPASVPTLSVFAIVAGLLFAFIPGIRKLSSHTGDDLPPSALEVDNFLRESRKVPDGH